MFYNDYFKDSNAGINDINIALCVSVEQTVLYTNDNSERDVSVLFMDSTIL